MKNRILWIPIVFSFLILLSAAFCCRLGRGEKAEEEKVRQILAANELEQLAAKGDMEEVSAKAAALQESLRTEESSTGKSGYILIISGVCVLYVVVVFGYIYFSILNPFEKMKQFAQQIAQGNFDVPLQYERSNYFGDFTWAFDSMRREITKARAAEKEAVENNKTVIATLSHDIKTPIASLRAYVEGLEANMDSSAEKRERYLSVILKKCDEVSRLTNDLFLHSVSDLDKLKVSVEQFELCGFLKVTIRDISAGRKDICLMLPEENVRVLADKNRFLQVCENLINNARKYAKANVDIRVDVKEELVEISFRDYGKGILDEDMPFVFGKFYRGKNCGEEAGSGLGLYIVKYIMEKMEGSVQLKNHLNGLEVVVSLKIS